MTADLHKTMKMIETIDSPAGVAALVEPALDDLKKHLHRIPEPDRVEVHNRLRNAYSGIDRMKGMK